MEKIMFYDTDLDESVELFVLEQTKINGVSYLLVTEDDEECFILKEKIEDPEKKESYYEAVVDDTELDALSKVFAELMEDVDFDKI